MRTLAIFASLLLAWTASAADLPEAKVGVVHQNDSKIGLIGVVIATNGHDIIVKHVMRESPAETAGIHAGDVLLSVDDASLQGISLPYIAKALQGSPGSTVRLDIRKHGQSNAIPISLVRKGFHVPTQAEFESGSRIMRMSPDVGPRDGGCESGKAFLRGPTKGQH